MATPFIPGPPDLNIPTAPTLTPEQLASRNPLTPFWHEPAIYVTLLLTPMVYFVVWTVLTPSNNYTSEIRVMVITAVMGFLSAIAGFWFASSYRSAASRRADAAAANNAAPVVNNYPTDSATTSISQGNPP